MILLRVVLMIAAVALLSGLFAFATKPIMDAPIERVFLYFLLFALGACMYLIVKRPTK